MASDCDCGPGEICDEKTFAVGNDGVVVQFLFGNCKNFRELVYWTCSIGLHELLRFPGDESPCEECDALKQHYRLSCVKE